MALALLLAHRDIEMTLIEANAKKCAFLREAARDSGASVRVACERVENTPLKRPVDVITARAFAPLDKLLGYAAPYLAQGAVCLFLKGRELEAELTEARKSWSISAETHPSLTAEDSHVLIVQKAKLSD